MSDSISQLKSDLTDRQLSVFNSEMAKHQKSTGVAYVLWIFLGTIGIHKFYMGKGKQGLLYLLLGLAGWIALIVGFASGAGAETAEAAGAAMAPGLVVGVVLLGILGILLLVDLFTIPRQISRQYEAKEREVIDRLHRESRNTRSGDEASGE
jgi:TM2 domain-containing membrane protein YozV